MKKKQRHQIQNILFSLKNIDFQEIKNTLSSGILDKKSQVYKDLEIIIQQQEELTLLVQDVLRKQNKCAEDVLNSLNNKPNSFNKHPIPEDEKNDDNSQNTEDNNSENVNNTDDSNPKDDEKTEKTKKKPNRNPKRITKTVSHALDKDQLNCPGCGKKMHKANKKYITIIRMTSILAEHHELETARCLTCETTVEAQGPTEKTICSFTHPCGASLTALRYVYGLPSYRLQDITGSLGYKVPDSTQWDLFEAIANAVKPFYFFLLTQAAQALMAQIDDTYMNILDTRAQFNTMGIDPEDPFGLSNKRNPKERTGINTTAFRATLLKGVVCLFDSGLHHAGEVFEKVMELRKKSESGKETPIILMTDGLAANTSKIKNMTTPVNVAHCNSHALRKFKELTDNPLFEDNTEHILKLYNQIFEVDKKLKKDKATAKDRLETHKKDSWPIMLSIKKKIETDLGINTSAENTPAYKVEPNSALGKAYGYFLKFFTKLSAFCHIEGAPVCNNAAERMLKRAIRHRKNSLFYKNEMGALVGDMLMTVLITAYENDQEPIQYLIDLLDHQELWKENPEPWLPWNITETKKALNQNQDITP